MGEGEREGGKDNFIEPFVLAVYMSRSYQTEVNSAFPVGLLFLALELKEGGEGGVMSL